MQERTLSPPSRAVWCLAAVVVVSWLMGATGCGLGTQLGEEVASMPGLAGVHRREVREQSTHDHSVKGRIASQPAEVAASHPAAPTGADGHAATPSTTAPANTVVPVVLDTNNIVQKLFDLSPVVQATREEMIAAEHALEEFKTNLSRLEPYINAEGNVAKYPERREARGNTSEIVGGVQKETFEGAILKLEGGASMSDFHYGEVGEDEVERDRGSGGLVRARVEVPFIGSRKRQERVISQAFQESQARKARLEYLSDFRLQVTNALSYYLLANLNNDYAMVADRQADVIESLLNDARLRPQDRFRLVSSMQSGRVTRDQYLTAKRTYVLLLLSLLGLPMDTPVELRELSDGPSPYLAKLSAPQGCEEMIAEAYANNPRFRVLEDAIADADLQRKNAIIGRYDITAYFEGTQFAFGAETYDDRVGGWLIGGGVNMRLNDNRVLTASRLKAEAQIRQYQAEIEAERLTIQRKIIDNSEQLRSYHKIGIEAREILKKKESEFRRRSTIYFEGSDPTLTIDDLLNSLSEWAVADNRVAANRYYVGLANLQIMTATGEVYRMVGMEIEGKKNAAGQ